MKELKFHKESECQRLKVPNKDNIYSGYFKFATQNTAVYDGYCFVESRNEIMKICVECDKVFAKKDQIAILRSSKLEIFKNNQLVKTIQIKGSSNIRDFLLNFEEDLGRVEDSSDIFMVDDKEMAINKQRILFDGNEYPNEIYEPGCRHFVAWRDKVAVVGNSKSFNFVYFYNGEMAEAEEYSPLSVRTDEDSLDSVPLVDIKFWRDKLLLIDEAFINVFAMSGLEKVSETDKAVVEYSIKDGKLIQSEISGMILDKEPLKLLEPGNELLPGAISGPKISSINNVASTSACENQKTGNYNATEPLLSTSNDHLNMPTECTRKNGLVPEKLDANRADEEARQLDIEFTQRITSIKNSFSQLQKKTAAPRCMVLVPSRFDFEGLYNLIFHNHTKEYEDVLSNMIFQIESLQSISESNISESIKYFDSKIFQKKSVKIPVKYHDPLCAKLNTCLKVSNPFDDLFEGIKVLNVQESNVFPKFEPKDAQAESAQNKDTPNEHGAKAEVASKILDQQPAVSADQNKPIDGTFTGVGQNAPSANDLNSQAGVNPRKPASSVINVGNAGPRTASLSNSQPISIPFGASIRDSSRFVAPANQPSVSLFNNTQQGVNSNLFVRDTSSLFSDIASTSLNMSGTNTQNASTAMNPAQDETGSTHVSAFNRLAGSRRLFK
ncbi:uncharacterized protein VICG_00262 [Vittaforma corneae ATCC 50505]|uniref:Uncharacterized protein n=1 Tax=Vittaforma corneae (strain ATCC 50505) TaxID=993615 RepID=L2GRI8_VITCO|nr:uncharacterized protein VICG_00262 [Vittaforma corneae ATCC 50505]ELA42947.1 hypothetical protein VICG_00262 [Vittaforma corneae ATCC 50505]